LQNSSSAATIPNPCPKSYTRSCLKRLAYLLDSTAVEGLFRSDLSTTSTATVTKAPSTTSAAAEPDKSEPPAIVAPQPIPMVPLPTISDPVACAATGPPAAGVDDVAVEDIDIASALAEVAFDEEPAAAAAPSNSGPPLSVHELLAQRLGLLNQSGSAPLQNLGAPTSTAKISIPSGPPIAPSEASVVSSTVTQSAASNGGGSSDIASLLADIVLPVEYVTPHVTEIPPPARFPVMQLPPSTRTFYHGKGKRGAVKEGAAPMESAAPVSLKDFSPEMRRKIAEDWLKEQLQHQTSD
jgi:hypothetical protein